jgi:hypothetical protein
MNEPATITHIRKIRVDALYGKRKHFNASERKANYNKIFGLFLILASVLTGSTFFALISKHAPVGAEWFGAIVSAFSLFLAAVQTYFQFGGQSTLHNRVANEYRIIAKEATLFLAKYSDQVVTLEEVAAKLDELSVAYNQVCATEQDCPTSKSDYKRAKKNIEEEETYTKAELTLAGDRNG